MLLTQRRVLQGLRTRPWHLRCSPLIENPVATCGEMVHPFVKQLANWSCSEVKRQIIRRGDQKNLKIIFDGFYLTRGFHTNNASGTIHDEQTGKVLQFAHRSKRGVGSNWTGTSRGAEGDIFEELLTNLQKDSSKTSYNVRNFTCVRTQWGYSQRPFQITTNITKTFTHQSGAGFTQRYNTKIIMYALNLKHYYH